jgi:hypothetical protein
MKEKLEKRLAELKNELASGENLLAELQVKQSSLQQTMLRISGAITLAEQLLAEEAKTEGVPPPNP